MNPNVLRRLSEPNRQDFQNTYEKASENGQEILELILSGLIAIHDGNFMLQNMEPPPLITNYKLDNSPYSKYVDKEFEEIMSKLPQDEHSIEVKEQYESSSPQEKVLLKQGASLQVEMLKLDIRATIVGFLEDSPEEIPDLPSILQSEGLPLQLSSFELKELIEQELARKNQKPFMEEEKTRELTNKEMHHISPSTLMMHIYFFLLKFEVNGHPRFTKNLKE